MNPTPARMGPSGLCGRRHHEYAPTNTYAATNRLRQITKPDGSTRIGLLATAQAVPAVATSPPTATAETASVRSMRRLHPSGPESVALSTGRESTAATRPSRHLRG